MTNFSDLETRMEALEVESRKFLDFSKRVSEKTQKSKKVKYVPPATAKEKHFAIYSDWASASGGVYIVFSPNMNMKKYLRSHGLEWKVAKRGWLFPANRTNEILKDMANDCPGWMRVGKNEAHMSFNEHPLLEHIGCLIKS